LTHYLRQSKRGEEVVVTERGKPIAVIQPIRTAEPTVSLDVRLARLADQGLITLPGAKAFQEAQDQDRWPAAVQDDPRRPQMNYLDTSALIKRFVAERGSGLVDARPVSRSS
jgi:antitoxin (DNA-binding transcriptional repressor) of toxin-antitoxin stability system